MSEIKVTKENVWRFYEKPQNFRIKCRFCDKHFCLKLGNFRRHLHKKHNKELMSIAKQNLKYTAEKYFRNSMCLICSEDVQLESFLDHVCLHWEKIEEIGIKQFCREGENFTIYCNFCSFPCFLFILISTLNNHIQCYHMEVLKNMRGETYNIVGSSERGLLTDAMCMPSNERGLLRNYTILENFRAKCKFCPREYTYIDIQNFREHLFKKYLQHEVKFLNLANRRETPERYFFKLKCLICKKFNVSQIFFDHLHSHPMDEVKIYEIEKNTWEYCSKNDNFEVRCNLCFETVTLTILKSVMYHMDIHTDLGHFRNTQGTYHMVGSSERDGDQILPMPSIITNESELWRNYTKLSNFQAKCQFCDFQDCYINITNFSQHVEKDHDEVILFEEECGQGWPGIYFKYHAPELSRCLICHGDVSCCHIQVLDWHLRECHRFNESDCHHYCCGWVWKYCEKRGDKVVVCECCSVEITLDVELSHLNHHIENTHLNNLSNMRRTNDDIAGPSGCQPK